MVRLASSNKLMYHRLMGHNDIGALFRGRLNIPLTSHVKKIFQKLKLQHKCVDCLLKTRCGPCYMISGKHRRLCFLCSQTQLLDRAGVILALEGHFATKTNLRKFIRSLRIAKKKKYSTGHPFGGEQVEEHVRGCSIAGRSKLVQR